MVSVLSGSFCVIYAENEPDSTLELPVFVLYHFSSERLSYKYLKKKWMGE